MDTSHIQPTLTDSEVLDFCKNGYLLLDGVVPDEINRRAVEFLDNDTYFEPTAILAEDWFMENVILNPAAAGAIRCLLGAGFTTPVLMSNHRVHMPREAQHWHRDGQSRYGPSLHYLQVFYYPEACTPEMGPTEVIPGSHYLFQHASFMGHYGGMRHSVKTAASAGSIFLTVYSIWHRRSASTAQGVRNLLKYNYWRTAPPARDWIVEPDFDFQLADYTFPITTPRQQFQECLDAAEMFFWLCGKADDYRTMGGQGWPLPGNRNAPSAGFPGDPTAVTY
ncbi:MAG: phytanoyl-CoA dioxygenase family protein [Chloroflexi bacterium]|nr:phytanoyl-CoA dioxygenase family protein [Chloroflexota bacterium]